MFRIIEGESRRMSRGGEYTGSDAQRRLLLPGCFLKSSGEDTYVEAVDGDPVIYANLVAGTRGDVIEAGVAAVGGEAYTAETDLFVSGVEGGDLGDPITITADASGRMISDLAVEGEMIYGYLKSVSDDDTLVTIAYLASNDGVVPAA